MWENGVLVNECDYWSERDASVCLSVSLSLTHTHTHAGADPRGVTSCRRRLLHDGRPLFLARRVQRYLVTRNVQSRDIIIRMLLYNLGTEACSPRARAAVIPAERRAPAAHGDAPHDDEVRRMLELERRRGATPSGR